MDAVAGAVEADPGEADGIVGAGRNAQFLADGDGFGIFGEECRIERVFRIFRPDDDAQGFAGRTLGLVGRDRAGKMGHELAVDAVGAERALFEADLDLGKRGKGLGFDERNGDDGAGGRIGPSRVGIQAAQSRAVDVEFFGEHFLDRREAHALLQGAFEPGGGIRRERGVVGGRDGIRGHHPVGVAEGGHDGLVDLAGGGLSVFLLPSGEGFFALGAPAAVDAAGGKMLAVEADLDGERDVDGNGRFGGRRRERLDDRRKGMGNRNRLRGCGRNRRRNRHVDAARQPKKCGSQSDNNKAEGTADVHGANMAETIAEDNGKAVFGG